MVIFVLTDYPGKLLQSELELYVPAVKDDIALEKRGDNVLIMCRQAIRYDTLFRISTGG